MAALIEPVVKMREAGCSIEDARDWLEENKRRVCHWISVDDLGHLYRGGRLSAAGAVVGTALGIKPIIDLNSEGKLITQEKVRSKNNVYAALARHLEDADNLDVIYITHAGAPEEAKKLAETIKKNYKVGEIRYSSIGPVVGCHTGPGTIAVVLGTRLTQVIFLSRGNIPENRLFRRFFRFPEADGLEVQPDLWYNFNIQLSPRPLPPDPLREPRETE